MKPLSSRQKRVVEKLLQAYDVRQNKPLFGKTADKLARLFVKRLRHNIRKNRFGYQIAEATIKARLAANVRHDTPYLFKEELIKSLSVKDGKVTISDGTHYSGLTYKELWFILEHGRRDKHIPARPVWRLTYEELFRASKKTWQRELQIIFKR
jgi:hypothetical protein